jgi:hypothetical protein
MVNYLAYCTFEFEQVSFKMGSNVVTLHAPERRIGTDHFTNILGIYCAKQSSRHGHVRLHAIYNRALCIMMHEMGLTRRIPTRVPMTISLDLRYPHIT